MKVASMPADNLPTSASATLVSTCILRRSSAMTKIMGAESDAAESGVLAVVCEVFRVALTVGLAVTFMAMPRHRALVFARGGLGDGRDGGQRINPAIERGEGINRRCCLFGRRILSHGVPLGFRDVQRPKRRRGLDGSRSLGASHSRTTGGTAGFPRSPRGSRIHRRAGVSDCRLLVSGLFFLGAYS